jgi:hypothetical protein
MSNFFDIATFSEMSGLYVLVLALCSFYAPYRPLIALSAVCFGCASSGPAHRRFLKSPPIIKKDYDFKDYVKMTRSRLSTTRMK